MAKQSGPKVYPFLVHMILAESIESEANTLARKGYELIHFSHFKTYRDEKGIERVLYLVAFKHSAHFATVSAGKCAGLSEV
jgi:hypothetical protein